jgi:hypothetical protein
MSREQFTEFVQGAILSLPQHLQGALRLVDDPNIPDEGRAIVAGAVLHWLSGLNTIPGVRGGVLSYVDDVLVLRLSYARVEAIAPEAMAKHRADWPELFGSLAEELELMRSFLGKGLTVIERAVDRIDQLKHKGVTASQCVADEQASTMLYDAVQAALVDVDLEEDAVARGLKQLDPVLEGLRQRPL